MVLGQIEASQLVFVLNKLVLNMMYFDMEKWDSLSNKVSRPSVSNQAYTMASS